MNREQILAALNEKFAGAVIKGFRLESDGVVILLEGGNELRIENEYPMCGDAAFLHVDGHSID